MGAGSQAVLLLAKPLVPIPAVVRLFTLVEGLRSALWLSATERHIGEAPNCQLLEMLEPDCGPGSGTGPQSPV